MSTDRVERSVTIHAPASRVWAALADSGEFGAWFGARLAGPFVPGATVRGVITTPGYEGHPMALFVERVEPERLLSFRWHAYPVESGDYTDVPTTLVELRVEARGATTEVTVVESGFDALPPGRREEASRSNAGGWEIQLGNIARHVAG